MKLNLIDKQWLGKEPLFVQPIETENDLRLANAYNWYSYSYDPAQSKEWALQFIKRHKKHGPDVIWCFERVSPDHIPNWVGAVARMDERGIKLPDSLIQRVYERCYEIAKLKFIGVPTIKSKAPIDHFRSKNVSKTIAVIDAYLDDFYNTGYSNFSMDLNEVSVSGLHAQLVYDYYNALYQELLSDNEDVAEAYDHLTKEQKTAYQKAVASILKGLEPWLEKPPVKPRKARKRKEKSPLKLVAKVKWCQEFAPLKLRSCHPSEIIGAQAVWLYNHKYNKLTHLKASGPSGLTIKGTTVLNIGEGSECKKIRKPETVIDRVLSGGKVVLRNLLSELKTKPLEPKGRIGTDTVILRVLR